MVEGRSKRNRTFSSILALLSTAVIGCTGGGKITAVLKSGGAEPAVQQGPAQAGGPQIEPAPNEGQTSPSDEFTAVAMQLGLTSDSQTLLTSWYGNLADPIKNQAFTDLSAIANEMNIMSPVQRAVLQSKIESHVSEALQSPGTTGHEINSLDFLALLRAELDLIMARIGDIAIEIASIEVKINDLRRALSPDGASVTAPSTDSGEQQSTADSGEQQSTADSGEEQSTAGSGEEQALPQDPAPQNEPASLFQVGGLLTGLRTGETVTLQNNGADDAVLLANGLFNFPSQVLEGSSYAVSILAQPAGQTCTVTNSSGSAGSEVSNISVSCVDNTVLTLSPDTLSGLNTSPSILGAAHTLTLTNHGVATTGTLLGAVLGGSSPSSFVIESDTCVGTTLAPAPGPGHTCTFAVRPVQVFNESYSATVTVSDGVATSNPASLAGAASGFAFVTTWQTTVPDESITVPLFSGETYDFSIDWGDGTVEAISTSASPSHIYENPGVYTIQIAGTFPRIYFNGTGDRQKILSIEQWGAISWRSMEHAFRGATGLQLNAQDTPDLRLVTSLRSTFQSATDFAGHPSMGSWDVSAVQDFGYTFSAANAFNQDLSAWNTSSATTFIRMFQGTAINMDFAGWNVSSVSSFFRMLDNINGSLSTQNYDALLASWSAQIVSANEDFVCSGCRYSYQSAGHLGRRDLILNHGWSINDGGPVSVPQLLLSPAQVSSLDIADGSSPGNSVVLTVTNSGAVTSLGLQTAKFASFEQGGIEIVNDLCQGQSLSPGQSCTFEVRPISTSNGVLAGVLTISDGETLANAASLSGSFLGFGLNSNTAPVLATAGQASLQPVGVNVANPQGTLVRNILRKDQIVDSEQGQLESIALTSVDNSNGQWEYATVDPV
jgi:hypothetical protein